MKQDTTRWEATGTPGLYVRQPGGGFYARITLNGKRTWRSLDTDKIREAQRRLRDLQNGFTRQVSTRTDDTLHAAMTGVIEFRATRRSIKNQELKSTTKAYHGEILASAKKLFPNRPLGTFDTKGLLKGIADCGLSQSRRKAIFELLKRTFSDAVENGTIKKNPLAGQIPGKVERKERKLPTRAQLDAIVAEVPRLFPRYGHRSAFTIRFLAFSGMRITEARNVMWEDVEEDRIRIRGGAEGLKSRDGDAVRYIDLNPPLRAVLNEIAGYYGREGRVIPGMSVRPQLKKACEKLKIAPLDHHDLRAWFITWGITSGVDVSTLAEWVGNSPTVLLERYAAVQDEIRKSSAAKLV